MDQRKRILFVDDEKNFLEAVRRLLRPFSDRWDISFTDSARQALQQIESTSFDVIVSDMSMPEMTGLDLIRHLQNTKLNPRTPVIILTGNGDIDLKRQALDNGATDLLTKPIGLEDLRARITSVLKLRDYQERLEEQNALLECKVRERTRELESSHLDIIWRLAKAGEYRDTESGHHVIRVAIYSRRLAEHLELSADDVATLFVTSSLHDIGKIGIPDGILLKEEILTAEERAVMERHCEIGANILLEEPISRAYWDGLLGTADGRSTAHPTDPLREMAATIALTHHERWDGTGYPRRLAGEEIPISGRIVAVADLYDALRSARPYKPAYSREKSSGLMEAASGTHIDPRLHRAFVVLSDEFEAVRERYPN